MAVGYNFDSLRDSLRDRSLLNKSAVVVVVDGCNESFCFSVCSEREVFILIDSLIAICKIQGYIFSY